MAQVQIIQPYQPQSEELEKVAAYCRVSTDSQDQFNSYRTQIGYYTNYIAQHPGWELADIYADEGITGTSLEKRDEFKRMLQDCRAGKISRILVKSVSRFARNTLELIETTRELKSLGVVVVFEEQGIDTAQMLGEMQLTLLAVAAQEESTSISKNVRWSYQKRMESGRFLGCSAPYGYKLENGAFTIVPEEAAVVQRIFDLFLSGNGILSITRTLNEEGIKTRQGANWATSSIEYLLSNERYAGDSRFQKYYSANTFPTKRKINHGERTQYYIGGTHEGIIPKETFERAQQVLQNHAHYAPPSSKFFQKKIVCPDCGNFFRETTIRGKRYWICRNRRNNQAACTPLRFTEQEIQGAFLSLICKSVSRFGRNSVDVLRTIRALRERGIGVMFEKESVDTRTMNSELILAFHSAFSQSESESIRENVSRGLRMAYEQGTIQIGPNLYGFRKGQNETVEIDEEKAAVIRQIARWFLDGDSLHAIVTKLAEHHIPSPKGKDTWSTATLRSLLTNEKYKGGSLPSKDLPAQPVLRPGGAERW